MKKKQYGRTSLQVSQLCLGAGRLGFLWDRADAYSVLDTFVENGGNFIQASAKSYLPSLECESGAAEFLIGEWLKGRRGVREGLVFSARIRCPPGAKGLELENSIRLQVESVLRRTGARYLDIALLDWTAGCFPAYEAMSVLERLADAGLLRCAGSVGFPCWRIAEWLGRGAQPSRMRLESAHLDGPFTQCCLEELAREHRVSLVVKWPYPAGYEPLFRTAKEVFGESAFQVGMAWLLSRPSIGSVLFSPKSASELTAAIEAARVQMSAEQSARVEDAYLQCALPPFCPEAERIEARPYSSRRALERVLRTGLRR